MGFSSPLPSTLCRFAIFVIIRGRLSEFAQHREVKIMASKKALDLLKSGDVETFNKWIKERRKKGKENLDLNDQNLGGLNLRNVDLQDARLNGSNLRKSDLKGANLRNARLRQADLRGANLQDADLTGADLRQSKKKNASFKKATLKDARGI
jgi:uncharacterized protein YjbI with pentapeptide repeats